MQILWLNAAGEHAERVDGCALGVRVCRMARALNYCQYIDILQKCYRIEFFDNYRPIYCQYPMIIAILKYRFQPLIIKPLSGELK